MEQNIVTASNDSFPPERGLPRPGEKNDCFGGKSCRSTAVATMAVAQGSSADASVTRFASDLPAAGRKIALPRNQVFDLPHSARSHSAAWPYPRWRSRRH
jgi:hypothetical protein